MKKIIQWAVYTSKIATIFFAATLVFTNYGFAQGVHRLLNQQGTQANPIPLSGRIGQNGSVKATQSPVPGTTTSVDTINPTVQVQG